MQTDVQSLPDNIEALKSLVHKHAAENKRLVSENLHFKTQVRSLQEQLNVLLAKRYGPSSEKLSPDQIRLFNEAEEQAQAVAEDEVAESVKVTGHTRKQRGRKPLPESLPRVRVEHELPEAEQICACGCQLTRIGEALSEQLDIIPAQVQVIQHVRGKYACKGCEETVKTAPMAPLPSSSSTSK